MANLPKGWVAWDSGTGNGKYLSLTLDRQGAIFTIGARLEVEITAIARKPEVAEVTGSRWVWGDVLGMGGDPVLL